ncbi:hypothetical protein OU997_18290 [Pseudomonas sp. SL4(2022)]|uniref:hypothetical protein n=1 Tax=Pseudomonas sp. SL4(2022) TaxID=2994661 RepID=UPI002271DCE3|nr:hypothetical protein [Pseudomonas sp. SL4(2022)]WAC44165.1 hypothetical protein OU997_18290 [Pseudomonas sp. SL4(2022)]
MSDLSHLELGIMLAVAANLLLVAVVAGLTAWIYFQLSARKPPQEAEQTQQAEASEIRANNILLTDMLNEVSEHSIEPFDQALSQGYELVSSIEGVTEANYAEWKLQHQSELDALIANRAEMEFKLDDLKAKLDRAHKLVTTLHAYKRQTDSRDDKLGTLQVKLQHLKEQMTHVQTEREHSLGEASELNQQLKQSKHQVKEVESQLHVLEEQARQQQVKFQHLREEMGHLQNQREQSLAEAMELRRLLSDTKQQGLDQVEHHRREVEEQNRLQTLLREEAELLRGQLERERDVLSRTLLEKDFIESAFLETDAATDQLLKFKSDYEELQKAHRLLQLKTNASSS